MRYNASVTEQPYYITTTLPYVNADPHIGFALEIVTADVIARYYRQLGYDVLFNTGTDEHGQKIWQKATELNLPPQAYVDQSVTGFAQLEAALQLSITTFTRTTNPAHQQAAQAFWQRCLANGHIYKKNYSSLYCVGCELEKQRSELVNNRCPLHPNQDLETREEENYFFAFSQFQSALLTLYSEQPDFVIPPSKQSEITSFVAGGLEDFSISRLKSKMPWGVAVPGDDQHVMYVWFDALVNYISAIGWPNDLATFHRYWPAVQIAGKDNLRQQAAMWQAMLLAAGLPPSRKILINGFISVAGQKMSKSLGNVISPFDLVERYGSDATRFLLLNLGPIAGDMDVTMERFDTEYTTWLVNGVGNLFSRIAKLCSRHTIDWLQAQTSFEFTTEFRTYFEQYEITNCLRWYHDRIQDLDLFLSQAQPWKLSGSEQQDVLLEAVRHLLSLAHHLLPVLPTASQQIINHFKQSAVTPAQPLFPRIPSV